MGNNWNKIQIKLTVIIHVELVLSTEVCFHLSLTNENCKLTKKKFHLKPERNLLLGALLLTFN